ncbi:MAG: hypothetical protein AB8G96_01140 [Phycisphaerales bacterium]
MSTSPPSDLLAAFGRPRLDGEALDGPESAVKALEESHLIVVVADETDRSGFAASVRNRLDVVHRGRIVDVSRLYPVLGSDADASTPAGEVEEALVELTARLRAASGIDKMQTFVWPDLDRLITIAPAAVRRAMHSAFAIAAEHEFVSPETLVLQRHLMFGGDRLAELAADVAGPARVWLEGDDAGAFPEAAEFCPSPRVAVARLG